jgi:hypothetical protein
MFARFLTILAAAFFALPTQAETLSDADEIIARADHASYYAGADGRSEVRMIITDAQGRQQRRQFTVLRRDVNDAGDQQFLVVFSQPSDVRNTVFLVEKHIDRDDDRWLYLPGLDLVKRISAGDKRTSFVGAHYFYEDVSGRRPSDDTHELVEVSDTFYLLRHTPKDPNSVEFSSYMTWIDRQTFLPMKIEYTNPAGDIYRRVRDRRVRRPPDRYDEPGFRPSDRRSDGYAVSLHQVRRRFTR